ncbi:MAG: thiopurine S-methyltransferase [Bdellovibrionales bacterium]|nr:thiopurine S-methyltransferase [Bdellovibrionales bacterium]
MESEFWHKKWEDKEIGFHQNEYNPDLLAYFTHLNLNKREEVLVPLCGKTKDIIWLYEQGYKVYGVELSPVAVMEFFQENDLLYNITMYKNHQCFHTTDNKINIFCGDIFDFDDSYNLPNFKAVFDRAAMVALPYDLRVKYANTLQKLAPEASHLLITFEYDQEKVQGPPFSVSEAEIRELFKGKNCKVLKEEEFPTNIERFKDTNIKDFSKKTLLIFNQS